MANEYTKKMMAKLEQGVEETFKSGKFQDWLNFQAKFHKYSYCNTILIFTQRPEASRVAGFSTWKDMGRFVKKGEKAIKILAPIFKKVKNEETDEEKQVLVAFKVVNVFDVAQTDGKELPDICKEIRTSSEVADQIIDGLFQVAKEKGIPVETYETGDAHGWYQPREHRIGLKNAAADQFAKTFLHEMAHAMTWEKGQAYAEGELIAEGTAYVVAQYFGLESGSYSFEYVAAWASRAEAEALKKVASTIQKTSDALINRLENAVKVSKTKKAA